MKIFLCVCVCMSWIHDFFSFFFLWSMRVFTIVFVAWSVTVVFLLKSKWSLFCTAPQIQYLSGLLLYKWQQIWGFASERWTQIVIMPTGQLDICAPKLVSKKTAAGVLQIFIAPNNIGTEMSTDISISLLKKELPQSLLLFNYFVFFCHNMFFFFFTETINGHRRPNLQFLIFTVESPSLNLKVFEEKT